MHVRGGTLDCDLSVQGQHKEPLGPRFMCNSSWLYGDLDNRFQNPSCLPTEVPAHAEDSISLRAQGTL